MSIFDVFYGTTLRPDIGMIDSVYGISPPAEEAVARREARVAECKERFVDKMRCAKPIGKLEK